MKKILSALAISAVLLGCNTDRELQFELQEFHKKTELPCSEPNCTEVKIKVPVLTEPKNAIAKAINQTVLEEVRKIIAFDDLQSDAVTYESIADSFIHSFEDIKKDFPQESAPWEASVDGKVLFHNPNLLSIELEHYVFSGGAHGYKGYSALNFNPEEGTLYTQEQLFKDLNGFAKLVESRLRKEFDLEPNAPINSKGLMFENNAFKLPESIFFHQDKVVAYYNTYEIASYADGPTALPFTYDEIRPFLNLNL